MKVCLLNDSFPPVIDGVVNVVLNYAAYLQNDHGSQVIVGTPRYPNADYTGYPYKVIPYQSFDTSSVASGYRAGNPFSGKSVSELAEFAPNIIHAHSPASSTILARVLREETGAPIVFTYHTKFDVDIERIMKFKPIAKETMRAMVANIEACDEVWAVSRGAAENLTALGYEGECRVMNNGVDFAKGRVTPQDVAEATAGWDLPDGVPVFLFVGRLMTYKGLPLILDALRLLSDAGQDFRMVFVGKGPDQELLEQKVKELDLTDTDTSPGKCMFTGPIYDRDALRAWNTRANLFLFPSTFDTNGLVVREAAACGLASVLIEGSCAAEGITHGHNGFTIPESAKAMAALLEQLCPDLDRLREVGQNAMDEIYLSWQSCVADAYDRYGAILEKKAGGHLPEKKKLPADHLVSLAAWGISEQEKHRRMRRELFDDFRDTAVGMMENIQEAEETAEHYREQIWQDIRQNWESLWKR